MGRISLEEPSKSADTPKGPLEHTNRFNKSVIVLIDALRFDFTIPSEKQPPLPFENRLDILYQLHSTRPENAILLHALADAPTTTTNRLTAILTGGLPNFVDASLNFAASQLMQDNFVDRAVQANKSIAFLGDDTWFVS